MNPAALPASQLAASVGTEMSTLNNMEAEHGLPKGSQFKVWHQLASLPPAERWGQLRMKAVQAKRAADDERFIQSKREEIQMELQRAEKLRAALEAASMQTNPQPTMGPTQPNLAENIAGFIAGFGPGGAEGANMATLQIADARQARELERKLADFQLQEANRKVQASLLAGDYQTAMQSVERQRELVDRLQRASADEEYDQNIKSAQSDLDYTRKVALEDQRAQNDMSQLEMRQSGDQEKEVLKAQLKAEADVRALLAAGYSEEEAVGVVRRRNEARINRDVSATNLNNVNAKLGPQRLGLQEKSLDERIRSNQAREGLQASGQSLTARGQDLQYDLGIKRLEAAQSRKEAGNPTEYDKVILDIAAKEGELQFLEDSIPDLESASEAELKTIRTLKQQIAGQKARANKLALDPEVAMRVLAPMEKVREFNTVMKAIGQGDVQISEQAAKVLNVAGQTVGGKIKYKWGGNGENGNFDCSSYTQEVFRVAGKSLPRTTGEQIKTGKAVAPTELAAGDLVFFHSTIQGRGKNQPSHVGIYIGDGNFIHNSSSANGVKISSLSEPYFKSRYLAARRHA